MYTNSRWYRVVSYWQVDSQLASDKALELDAALGSCSVQYRELQGQETEKFLSYFKPCIIPIEGTYSSQGGHCNNETYRVSLFTCRGDPTIRVKEVSHSSSLKIGHITYICNTPIWTYVNCIAMLNLWYSVIDNISLVIRVP